HLLLPLPLNHQPRRGDMLVARGETVRSTPRGMASARFFVARVPQNPVALAGNYWLLHLQLLSGAVQKVRFCSLVDGVMKDDLEKVSGLYWSFSKTMPLPWLPAFLGCG